MKVEENFKKMKNKVKDFFTKRRKRTDTGVGFSLLEVIVLVAIATVIGVFGGSVLAYGLDWEFNRGNKPVTNSKYIDEFEEAFDNVVDKYYENVNKEDLIDAAIDGMLSSLDDYTSYMTPDENKQFTERLNGEYQGIGIEFISIQNGNYTHTITGVFENSPAAVAGIQKDDVIISVDNIDVSTKTGNEIASYIKEKATSEITLVIKRNDENMTLKISKSLISLPSVTSKVFERNGHKVGFIDISLFANNTYNQFKDALKSLETQGIKALIIDVRNNSGGYLHTTDDILELFMKKDAVLYKTQKKNRVIEYKDNTEEHRTYEVAVLINANSASASEILAASFKDTYGAEIIGDKSFGKGTVQQPADLSNGGMIKVTTEKWLTPNGDWINNKGVSPTIAVQMGSDYIISPTEENDTQLQQAIELLAK